MQRLFMSEKKRRWSHLISDALLLHAKRVKKHEEMRGEKKEMQKGILKSGRVNLPQSQRPCWAIGIILLRKNPQ